MHVTAWYLLARFVAALTRIGALQRIAALQWIAVLPRVVTLFVCACLPAAAPADTATVELSDRAFSRFFHINGNLDHHIRSLGTWNVPGYYCIGFEYPNKDGELQVIAQIRARTRADEAEYRRLVDLIPQIMASPHAQGMIAATGLPDPSTPEFTAFFERKFGSLYELLDEVEAAIRATPERDCGLTDQQLARADVYPPSYRTVPGITPPAGPLCPDEYWEALNAVARARADAEFNAFLAHKYLVAIRDARRAGLAPDKELAAREATAKADVDRWDAKVRELTALHAQIKATPIKDCTSGETGGGATGGGATGGGTPPGQQPTPPAGPGGDPGVRLHEPKIIEAPAPGDYTFFCSEFDRNVAIAAAEKAATAASHNSRQWLIRLDDIRSALLHGFGNADVLRQHRAHAQAQIRYWNERAAKAHAAVEAYKRVPITECELDEYWTRSPTVGDWQPPSLPLIELIEWPQGACALTPDQQALLELQAHQAEHAAARAVSAVTASLASFLASVRDGARVAAAMITGQAIIDGLDETTRRNAEGRQRFAESAATCPEADPTRPATGTAPLTPVPPKTATSMPGTGTGGATGGATTGGGSSGTTGSSTGGGAAGGGGATSGNRATVVTPPLTQGSRAATQCKPCQPVADEYNDLVAQHEAQKRAMRRYREAQQLIDENRGRLQAAQAATSDQAAKQRLQKVMDDQAAQRDLYERDIQKARARMTELEAQMKAALARLRECEETCRRQVAQGVVDLVAIEAPFGPRLGVPPLAGKVITVCLACQPQARVYNAIVESINAVIVEIGHEAQLYAQSSLNREAAWRRYTDLMREWEALEADLDEAHQALVACEDKCQQASNTIEPKEQWTCSVTFKSFEEFRQWRRDYGSTTPAWEFSTGWIGDGNFQLEAEWGPTIRLTRQFDVELPGSGGIGTGGSQTPGIGGSTAPGTGFYPRPLIEDDLIGVPAGSGTHVRPWPRFEYVDGVWRATKPLTGGIRIDGTFGLGAAHDYRMDPRDLFDDDEGRSGALDDPYRGAGRYLQGSALADPVWVPDNPFSFLGWHPSFGDPGYGDAAGSGSGRRDAFLGGAWLAGGRFRYDDWKPFPSGSDRVSGHVNDFLNDGIRIRLAPRWDDEDDEEGGGPIYFLGPIETGYTSPIGVIPNAGFRSDRTIGGQGSGLKFRYQVQDRWNLNAAWQFNARPDAGSAPAIDTRGWKIDSRYRIDPALFESLYGDQSSWSSWHSRYVGPSLAGFAVAPGFKPSLPAYVDDASSTRMQVFAGDDRYPPGSAGSGPDDMCKGLPNGRRVAIDVMAEQPRGAAQTLRTAVAIRQHDGAWSPEALLEGRRAPWSSADAKGSSLSFLEAQNEALEVPACPKPAAANDCERQANDSLAALGKELETARRSLQSVEDLHELRGRVVDKIVAQRRTGAGDSSAVSDADVREAGEAFVAAQRARGEVASLSARMRGVAETLSRCPAPTTPPAGSSCAVTLSLISGSTETTYLLDSNLRGEDADAKRLARWLLERAEPYPQAGALRLRFVPGEDAARQEKP